MKERQGMTYKRAGVSISDGNRFAAMVKERIASAWPECAEEIGGFAGGGRIPAGASTVKGCCDSSGTKAKLAALTGDSVMLRADGQDAAAMSLVDAFVAGAYPAYALDTISVGKLDPDLHINIVEGVIDACKLAGAKLIGGETAELPGIFQHPWMFLADTTVIAFPSPELAYVPMAAGHQVFGWLSYGPAANGFSLIRRVFDLDGLTGFRRLFHLGGSPALARKRLEQRWPELGGKTLAEAILRPTPIYIKPAEILRKKGVQFSGHAHVTGGGLVENVPRILPPNLKVIINRGSWPQPAIFPLIQRLGNVPTGDMDRTFNQGIIMVSIGPRECMDICLATAGIGDVICHIGEVVEREGNEPQVKLVGKYTKEY